MLQAIQSFEGKIERLLQEKPVIMQLLRFAAIGSLNTALDFILLNYITKSYGINSGIALGVLNVISFTAAIIQSYLWNKAWAFAESTGGLVQNLYRLVLVGGLGFASFVLVFTGAGYNALPNFYLLVLISFILIQLTFWVLFHLKIKSAENESAHKNLFLVFLIVSLIGLLINSGVVAIASGFIAPYLSGKVNGDVVKNIAKALATCFSLVWNFLGYKLIVFKK